MSTLRLSFDFSAREFSGYDAFGTAAVVAGVNLQIVGSSGVLGLDFVASHSDTRMVTTPSSEDLQPLETS